MPSIIFCIALFIDTPLALRLRTTHVGLSAEKFQNLPIFPHDTLNEVQENVTCSAYMDGGTRPNFFGQNGGKPLKIEPSPIKKFVIVTLARSGSNWLLSLLNESKSLQTNPEPFNGMEIYADFSGHEQWDLASRDRDRSKFINDMFQQGASHNFSHSGFKVLLGWPNKQLSGAEFQSLVEAPDVQKIILMRRNTVKQFVSLAKAFESNAFIDEDTSHMKVHFNVTTFLDYAKEKELIHKKCLSHKDWHSMMYEDLVEDTPKEMAALQDFLQVERQDVCSDCMVKRQSHGPLSNSIENWEEVVKALKGTKYEAQLGLDNDKTLLDLIDDS